MADFLNKMKAGLYKGLDTVSTSSKNMLEKNKLNGDIKTMEEEKKQLFEILGNKLYEYYKETNSASIPEEEIIPICGEIYDRTVKVLECKRRIEELDAEKVHPAPAPAPVPPSVPAPGKVCSCGQQNAADAKFCVSCGTPFNN